MRSGRRLNPGRYRAFVYALLVHAFVITGLIIGFSWSSAPVGTIEKTIQATAVEDPEKKKLEEERRRAEEERKKAEAEHKRQEVEAQKKREQELRAEERRQKEEAEKQRLAEQKRKQEEEAKHREDERKKAESQQAAAEELKKQIEKEEGERAAAAREARAASEFDKYKALIQQKVQRNWIAVGTAAGLEAQVRVRLAPGGEVLQATVVKGSGNPIFDRSVPPAVYKASPLPIPKDPDLFEYFRDLEFTFKPK